MLICARAVSVPTTRARSTPPHMRPRRQRRAERGAQRAHARVDKRHTAKPLCVRARESAHAKRAHTHYHKISGGRRRGRRRSPRRAAARSRAGSSATHARGAAHAGPADHHAAAAVPDYVRNPNTTTKSARAAGAPPRARRTRALAFMTTGGGRRSVLITRLGGGNPPSNAPLYDHVIHITHPVPGANETVGRGECRARAVVEGSRVKDCRAVDMATSPRRPQSARPANDHSEGAEEGGGGLLVR